VHLSRSLAACCPIMHEVHGTTGSSNGWANLQSTLCIKSVKMDNALTDVTTYRC